MRTVSDAGRKEGDPSRDLVQLMYDLRKTAPDSHLLICVPPAIYAEALALANRSGYPKYQSTLHAQSGAVHMLFCGHWISPEQPMEMPI